MRDHSGPIEVSVVAPVFNERENLRPLVDELLTALRPGSRPFEILLVDDGSRDGSSELIDALAAEHPEVRGVHFKANCGQTAAFDAGFKHARGAIVVTIDADLQNDPRDIPALLRALAGHDAAVGFRVERHDGTIRRWSSKIGNAVRNRISGDDIIDTGCSLKAFRAVARDQALERHASLPSHLDAHRGTKRGSGPGRSPAPVEGNEQVRRLEPVVPLLRGSARGAMDEIAPLGL